MNSAKQEEQSFSNKKASVPLRMLQPNRDPGSQAVCEIDLANDVAEIAHQLFLTAHFFGNGDSSFFPL